VIVHDLSENALCKARYLVSCWIRAGRHSALQPSADMQCWTRRRCQSLGCRACRQCAERADAISELVSW